MTKSKDKGNRWERDSVKILNERYPDTWRKIPGSGALGTALNIPILKSDVLGKYYFLPFVLRAENKVGYGGKEMQVKKIWFDKVRREAESNFNNVPCVLIKFDNARDGARYFIGLDFDAWHKILAYTEDLYLENVSLRNEKADTKTS